MMLLIATCFLYALALSDYQCPNNQTLCHIICGNNPSTQCQNSLINASSVTTELTILCPDLSSCRNMTTICPIGNNTKCEVSCTDSLSCDYTTIHSESTETTLNCISSGIDYEQICTNNITINLSQNVRKTTINCALNATNTNSTNVMLCNDIKVTATNTNSNQSLLSFNCQGNGVECDSININAPNTDALHVILKGTSSNLNNSIFINNNNMNIEMNDDSLISMTSFIGTAMVHGSSVSIQMANGSISRSNAFIFNDITSFEMVNTKSTDSALLTQSNITINNDIGRVQNVIIDGIIGDGTNNLTAQKASTFTLKCRNNYTKCGGFGVFNVDKVQDIKVLIDKGVVFGSIINAQNVLGVNITALEGAVLDGLSLNAAEVEQIHFNVYGETRGINVINGSTASGFAIYCNNPKSCSGDLDIIISPHRTAINCIGTGCDMMTLNVAESADELSVSMQYCPCEDERRTLCITEWNIICYGFKTARIEDGECTGACCGGIINQLQETYTDKYACPVRANKTMYICQEEEECIIDCRNITQYGDKSVFECSSKSIIDGSMSGSLSVLCDVGDAACSQLKVLCPANSGCNISCNGDCLDIDVIGNASDVLFECIDSSCSCINVDNNNGDVSIYMTGINSNFSDSAILSDCVFISGDSYVFANNNITYLSNGIAVKVDGDSAAWFELNRLIEKEGDVYTLSINSNGVYHSETSNISFTIIDNDLMFKKADYVEILIDKNNSFSHKTIEMVHSSSHLYIFNWGLLKHNIFGSGDMEKVIFTCNGLCLSNKILMNNIRQFNLVVLSEGRIHDENTDFEIAHIDTLLIMANEGGNITHINFDELKPNVVSITNSHGFISNISLNATDATNFTLTCFGGCNDTLIPNQYILKNVDNVVFGVMNDVINPLNTVILNATNISTFELVANLNGIITDILVNETVKNMFISCNKEGIINNLSVSSPMIDVIKVDNDNGIINQLNIKPRNALNKVIVNITGTLSNSSIDAKKSNNLSVICSNALDGYCSNLTLMLPVSDTAVSSLLCKAQGCQNITFYTVNDIDDMDLSLTECPCGEAVKSSCIKSDNQWNIYCESNKDGQASVFADNKCDGVCCGDIVMDLRVKDCDYSGASKKKHNHGAVVGVVCAVILVFVITGSGVYYFKKKKKAEAEADALLINQ